MAGGGGRDSVAPSDTGLVSYRSLGSSFPPVGPLAILAALFLCKSLLCRCCCCYNALLSIGIRRISPSSFFSSVFCFVQAISTSSPPTRTFSVFLIVSLSLPAPTSHLLVALRPLDAPRQCFFFLSNVQCGRKKKHFVSIGAWHHPVAVYSRRRRVVVVKGPARRPPPHASVSAPARAPGTHGSASVLVSADLIWLTGTVYPTRAFFFLFNLFAS